MKTILFISNRCGAAGVEAQLLQLVTKLSGSYHIGVLLARQGDNPAMLETLCRYAKVFIGRQAMSAEFRGFARQVDAVWVLSAYPLIVYHLIHHWIRQARLLLAVYHPDEYLWPKQTPVSIRTLISTIWQSLPPSNVYFINEMCRARHAATFGNAFAGSLILPLFISPESRAVSRSHTKKFKFVSVGRITCFKTYNFEMLPIIARLANEYPIEYHIYGDGELMRQLKDKVQEMRLQDVVFLHGAIVFTERFTPYVDAYGFVGMGLSMIESSSCGVPSVAAIEGDTNSQCYGLFSDLTGLNVGEMDSSIPMVSLEDTLKNLLEMDEDSYANLVEKHQKRALQFSNESIESSVSAFLNGSEYRQFKVYPFLAIVALLQIMIFKFMEVIGISTWHSNRYSCRKATLGRAESNHSEG